jgi:diguanylate cyclase (GGDEF)-like protein
MRLRVALLLLIGFANPVPAAEFEIESLDQIVEMHGIWRFRTGDDMRWADPEYDHRLWGNILVPRDWRRQGHGNLSGMAWYRATVQFDLEKPAVRDSLHELGVSLGKIHSAYEFYAGGILLGRTGSLPPDPEAVYDRIRTFVIPAEAISEDGKLVLAVRVWRDPVLGRSSTSGMYGGNFVLGGVFDLIRSVYFAEALTLMLAISYFVFGIYHIYLYVWNRRQKEFLWFGVTTLLVAIYSLELTQWKYVVELLAGVPPAVHRKLEYGVIYALPASGLQLVFSLMQFQPPRWMRLYQSGFLVLALLALLVPGSAILVRTLFFWQMYTLPGMVVVLVMVMWYAVQGNIEARTMLLGWAIFLFTAINDMLVAQGLVQNARLLTFGFAAILVSMAISLANRFTRMYNHMDAEVQQRTRELEIINDKLIEAARQDTLTGLLNRRGFMERAVAEVSRVKRSGRPFVIMMADIDRFKLINDRYGHACGDFVLQQTAALLTDQLRDVDILARWGGEEFIFLLPDTSLEGGQVSAEKLRKVLERTEFAWRERVLNLTITIGISSFGDRTQTIENSIAHADDALYEGKQGGRNRVVAANRRSSQGATGASTR